MKFFKLLIGASLIVFLTTGCNITSESPEELIKDKPIYNRNEADLYKGIKKLLTKQTSLLQPNNSKEAAKINEVDLDNDGEKELVVFQKKESQDDKKDEVGFIVLTKNPDGTYTNKEKAYSLQEGEEIQYANFYDLNNDGNKEIVLLIKSEGKTNMYIYNFIDDEVKKVYTLNPTWLEDNKNLLDMKVKIGYIDGDDKLDILMLHFNSKTNKAYASLANFDKGLKLSNYVEFDNIKSLNNSYITLGTISTENKKGKTIEHKGIVLDMPIIKNDNYITQILYLKEGKLKKAFKDDDKSIMKPYYIPVEDINNDKVLDIPIVNGSGNIYTSKTSATISWYRWNGKDNLEDSSLLFTIQIYYNYQYKFRLLIPNELVNKLDIEQDYQEQSSDVLFKFYYYDILETEPKELFTIAVVNKNLIDENKKNVNQSAIILGENNDYTFTLYINNLEQLKKLKINEGSLKEYFSLIY